MEEPELTSAGGSAARRAPAPGGGRAGEPPRLFAWIASLAMGLLLVAGLFLERGDNASLRAAGVALLALSGPFIFAPFVLLARHGGGEEGESYMQTGAVVERGLYAVVRHPQYLGYMLLACGFSLLWQRWPAALLAAVGVAGFYRQAVQEEAYCLAQFGGAYEEYRRRVPRFNLVLGLVRLWRRGRA